MNDRPLNSYYYTPHCSNYVVHWASLGAPFPNKKTGKKRTPLLASSSLLFLSLLPNLLSSLQLCGVPVSAGSDYPFSFLSPACARTPEAPVFVPWGPGALRSPSSSTWNWGRQLLSNPQQDQGWLRGGQSGPLLSPYSPSHS